MLLWIGRCCLTFDITGASGFIAGVRVDGWVGRLTIRKEKQDMTKCRHKRYSVDVHEQTGTCYDCGAVGRMRFIVDQEWKPIETAPRDGTRILLYRPLAERTNDYPIDIKRGVPRDNGCWEETIPNGLSGENYTDGACRATHWMLLPEPPNCNSPTDTVG